MTACAPDSSYRWLRALRASVLPPGVDDQDDDQLPELAYESFFHRYAEDALVATRIYAEALGAFAGSTDSAPRRSGYEQARTRFVATLPFVHDRGLGGLEDVPGDPADLPRRLDALRRYEAALEALLARRRYLASDEPIG